MFKRSLRGRMVDKTTEGDVEVQNVLPLFIEAEFLGFPRSHVRSKPYLAAKDIGKGKSSRKGYVPDFCIYAESLPALIIETKAPGENARQAYNEATLYALEINKSFESNVNPCRFVFATNGEQFFAGHWDSDPTLDGLIADLTPGSSQLSKLRDLLGPEAVEKVARAATTTLRKHRYRRATSLGDGAAMLNSKLEPNTFAADLAPTLRRYFASKDQNDDPEIYDKAYISSDEVTSYDRILESFLKDRAARLQSSKEVKTTRKAAFEISTALRILKKRKSASGELQLITGGVGAGKSLFARRYKELLLPDDLKESTHWSFLDFNQAASLTEESKTWVSLNFVESLLREGAPINLRDAADQERVFSADLADRRAYYERMENLSTGRGELEKARDLESWRQDPFRAARGCSRYLQGDRAESIVAVFDNVDRRDSEEQLIAFQLALWFMAETRTLVLLQMRDATFEAYKDEPPLDTYKTGQIFHVSPPRFVDVVRRRLELALAAFDQDSHGEVHYKTTGGVKVSYPKSRAGNFLRQVYYEVFQQRKNIAVILESLAGRDVRKSLDMFMAIITSGHMPEEMISSIAHDRQVASLPEWILIRVLMRQDYRFFNNNSGFVYNIFDCDLKSVRPSNFLRIEILFHLIASRKVRGANGLEGFVAVTGLKHRLEHMGFVVGDVMLAIEALLNQGLIESDTFSTKGIDEQVSVRATASAWAHMRLLSCRMEYVSSVLPITPVANDILLTKVESGLSDESRTGHLSIGRRIALVRAFHRYLKSEYERHLAHPGYANIERTGARYIIDKVEDSFEFSRNTKVTQLDLLDS